MVVATDDSKPKENGLPYVKLLLKRVTRGFYEPKHCILLDIVLSHSAIRDDHVAQIMGLQNQEVRKLCGRLREDRFLTLHTRLETKEGQTRPLHRTYYYIDYRDAVDSIKYRVHRLVRTIEEKSKNDFDSKGYVCPFCQRRYGPLDVLPYVSMDGQSFTCATCGQTLADDEESLESRASQERLGKLQQQTARIIATLKQIDASHVPNNDFVAAMANAVPPNLDLVYSAAYPHGIPSTHNLGRNGAGAGSGQYSDRTTTSALGVTIDYSGGGTRGDASQTGAAGVGAAGGVNGETAEERARREGQMKMNQLPDWHKHSTVPGSSSLLPSLATTDYGSRDHAREPQDTKDVDGSTGAGANAGAGAGGTGVNGLDKNAADAVAEYYRALNARKHTSSSTDSNDDDDDDDEEENEASDEDEDEMEMEDVDVGPGPGVGQTTASNLVTDTDTEGTITRVAGGTRTTGDTTQGDAPRLAQVPGTIASPALTKTGSGDAVVTGVRVDSDSESDEGEFEDV